MVDYKKFQRKRKQLDDNKKILFNCIAKGYAEYNIDVDGKEYIRITEKGENSMAIDAEKLRELATSFTLEKSEKVRMTEDLDLIKRKKEVF